MNIIPIAICVPNTAGKKSVYDTCVQSLENKVIVIVSKEGLKEFQPLSLKQVWSGLRISVSSYASKLDVVCGICNILNGEEHHFTEIWTEILKQVF